MNNNEEFVKPFEIEYAKSGRSKCKKCNKKIAKGHLRLGSRAWFFRKDGHIPSWYHFNCFFITGFDESELKRLQNISDFDLIRYEDQVKYIEASGVEVDLMSHEEIEIKAQNEIFFNHFDKLSGLSKKELQKVLKKNNYRKLRGKPQIIKRLAEFMTFGATRKCPKCFYGNLIYENNVYQCRNRNVFGVRCMYTVDNPKRRPFVMTENLQKLFPNYVHNVFKNRRLRTFPTDDTDEIDVAEGPSPSKKLKVEIHNGIAVDSGLSRIPKNCSIFKDENDVLFCCTLVKYDLKLNHNSFYKMKIFKSNENDDAYLLIDFGRTGENCSLTIKKLENVAAAIELFKKKFQEKTGLHWDFKFFFGSFPLMPNKYAILNVDYQEEKIAGEISANINCSDLGSSICELIKLLFNREILEKTLVEFEIDMSMMPHGMLSNKNLDEAENILNKILSDLENNQDNQDIFAKNSEDFYYLVPQSLGFLNLPIINSFTEVAKKFGLIQELRTMELCYRYSLPSKTFLTDCYGSLDTNINAISSESDEFVIIKEYAESTLFDYETKIPFSIEEIFEVKRFDDAERFKPHDNAKNRYLLWHGSRVVNFASILKNGLKVQPPSNAKTSGKMFGHGIYFADMIAKSANYLYPEKDEKSALLLLCEVALGKIFETREALGSRFTGKDLEEGKDSLKGVGRIYPECQRTLENGCIVPMGPKAHNDSIVSVLRYNEYVIYDESRCKMKYLVRVKISGKPK